MSLDELISLLPPPGKPSEIPQVAAWAEAESRLGSSLPGDYKAYLNCYGTGVIDAFLWIFSPFSRNQNLNLFRRLELHTKTFEYLERGAFEDLPFPVYPATGGLLPIAATDNGDILFWRVSGAPDSWPVILNSARSPEYEQYTMGLVDFLVGVLARRVRSEVLPAAFPSVAPTFTSFLPATPDERGSE